MQTSVTRNQSILIPTVDRHVFHLGVLQRWKRSVGRTLPLIGPPTR